MSRNPITFEGPVVAVQTILEHPECGLQSIEFRVFTENDSYLDRN